MRLTRWTHSCVRLDHDGRSVVIDPGVWSEPRALHGVEAVLVTHEHGDHVDTLRLRGLGAPVHAPAGADLGDLAFSPVAAGDVIHVAGLDVRAVGGRHAAVLPGQATCRNLGFLISTPDDPEAAVYHPGDALHVPDRPVGTLLVPMQASWLKTSEAVDFVRAVAPERAVGIHDGQINGRARVSINRWLHTEGRTSYEWLEPGTTIEC